MKKVLLLTIALMAMVSAKTASKAQDSLRAGTPKSIIAEEFIGDNRQYFFLMGNATIVESKKIGLLSISSYSTDYDRTLSTTEYLNTTLIYHHLYGGISINSGASFTSLEGLKNFVGLQYLYQDQTLSVL